MAENTITPAQPTVVPVTVPVEQKSPELVTNEPKSTDAELGIESKVKPDAQASGESTSTESASGSADGGEAKGAADDAVKNAAARERVLRLLNPDKPAAATQPEKKADAGDLKKPDINAFKTLEEYDAAVIEYGRQLGKGESTTEATQAKQAERQAAIIKKVTASVNESRKKYADYDATVAPFAPIFDRVPLLKEFIGDSEQRAEIMYHLSKNPSVLEDLLGKEPFAAGRQLINLETRLKTAAAPVAQSSAPDPIKPVGNRENVKVKLVDLATKDVSGFIKKRNAQELAKKRS